MQVAASTMYSTPTNRRPPSQGSYVTASGREASISPSPCGAREAWRDSRAIAQQRLGDTTCVEFDQSLNYCIRQIRLALRDGASEPLYIETLPRQGYRFIGSLDEKAKLELRARRWRLQEYRTSTGTVASGRAMGLHPLCGSALC